jgi:peptidylprolyl isomerase
MDRTKPEITIPAGEEPGKALLTDDLELGTGETAQPGHQVEVHYVGVSWATGEQFDASWDRGDPLEFRLGVGMVIQGWDEGIAGMKVGGRRKLHIPARLAYGEHGLAGIIPPGATLLFEIELLEILGPRQAPTPIGV